MTLILYNGIVNNKLLNVVLQCILYIKYLFLKTCVEGAFLFGNKVFSL